MLIEDYRSFVRRHGAVMDIKQFASLVRQRTKLGGTAVKIPKAVESMVDDPEAKALIDAFNSAQATSLQQEMFKQRKRVVDAERVLQTKTTKKAQEDVRIGTEKVEAIKVKLDDLERTEFKPRDARFFPGSYVPVLIERDGQRVVMPMRYQCRPAGKPAFYDTKYPGTYNARRDSLEGFWKGQFGHTHGLIAIERFYENVEGPDGNVRLEFVPADRSVMLVACLWSHWTDPKGIEPDLWSFAAITDEPEPEVAAAGHDRTIINIKPEHVDAWLNPDPGNLAALYAIFDDKRHPFYEHRIAA